MEISVTDFSGPILASVLKFCVHLQVGKVYYVLEIKMLILILPSFFNFPSFTLIIHMDIFSVKDFSATT